MLDEVVKAQVSVSEDEDVFIDSSGGVHCLWCCRVDWIMQIFHVFWVMRPVLFLTFFLFKMFWCGMWGIR